MGRKLADYRTKEQRLSEALGLQRTGIFDAAAFTLAFYHRDHDQAADVVAASVA